MAELAIIGLAAKIAAGKDHMSSIISSRRGFFQISFADHLKISLIASEEMSWEEAFITKPQWVRERLQQVGTEEMRDLPGMEDFWVNALESWIQIFHHRHRITKFVIGDVRFINEVEWIHENEGVVIRLDSDRESTEELTPEQTTHRSEVSLDSYNFHHRVLNNEADAEESEIAVIELVDMYLRSGAHDGQIF
ncbi:hypothetical protein LCGC14_1406970 [marine sediment metagenome]|uniref:Uncharacterized protein n=1 Tax=marine sediment metagenome TaxID=412755 RepID=A0A0F9JVS8_9ZZZZ